MKKILFFILILMPTLVFANGGDQRIAPGGRYYVNLSRAPFTPRVGIKDSMLASFFDIQANRLIAEDILVRIRISKLGGAGSAKREFLFEQDNVKVRGGVLEFPYTFSESGLHEIFFDFAFASDPKKVYEVPDFLLDIQEPQITRNIEKSAILISALLSGILGFALGWVLRSRRTRIPT